MSGSDENCLRLIGLATSQHFVKIFINIKTKRTERSVQATRV